MIIHVHTRVYNDAWMLKFFLRHYETFADKIFIHDCKSTDHTKELALSHSLVDYKVCSIQGIHEGLYNDYDRMAYITHSRGKADWVFMVDSDEFMWHPNIRKLLETLQKNGYDSICPIGYAINTKHEVIDNGKQLYEIIGQGFRMQNNVIGGRDEAKVLVFKPELDIVWTYGKHIIPTGCKNLYHGGLYYLHCSICGKDWYIDKIKRRRERQSKFNLLNKLTGNTMKTLDETLQEINDYHDLCKPINFEGWKTNENGTTILL